VHFDLTDRQGLDRLRVAELARTLEDALPAPAATADPEWRP
jgi:hypothetical protein